MTDSADGAFAPRRIAVIGAGPVGCVLAAALAGNGHEVILCDLDPALLAPASDPGIRIEGALRFSGAVARTVTSIDALAPYGPELLIVASKATALPLIASALETVHRPGMYVLSWQNGLDTERVLAEHLGAEWVMRAVVNFGVILLGPAHVRVAFNQPPHWLQEMHEASAPVAAAVCRLLSDAGIPTRHADRLIDRVWQKVILNTALAPICAVTGKTMAQALRDPFLCDLSEKLVKEGITIARANEIHLGWDFYRYAMNWLKECGDHKPSMLVDIESGRITEAEFICGRIAAYAEMAGREAPYNLTMRALVKGLETGNRPG